MATVEKLEGDLADLGVRLEAARADRIAKIQHARKLAAQAEATKDNKVIHAQASANRAIETVSRRILGLEQEIADMKRRLDLARAQQAGIASRLAAEASAGVIHDKVFEVATPDGRVVRHKHSSFDALCASLQAGYWIRAQVFGADADGQGGFSVATGQREAVLKAVAEIEG